MIVGIDIRSLASGRRSGVEEYVVRLIRELVTIDQSIQYKLFQSGLKSAHEIFCLDEFSNVEIVHIKFPNKLINFSSTFFHYPKIDRLLGGVDVLFFPNMLFGSSSPNIPLVVTFHDASFVHFNEFLNVKRKLWHWLVNPKKIACKATSIISVSRSTKEDLVNTFNISPEKIDVVYSGMAHCDSETPNKITYVRHKYSLPEKYLLCFGTVEPRKNIYGIIESFLSFRKDNPEYVLVIAGGEGWRMRDGLKRALSNIPNDSILFTGFIDEVDKHAVYQAAEMFIFLSFFEGFGFPLLEAADAGTPIIASANSSIFEIIGDGALLVDPSNVYEIESAMRLLVSSPTVSHSLSKKAQSRTFQFIHNQSAQKTLEILKKAYEKRR